MTILAKKFIGLDACGTDEAQKAIYKVKHDTWGVLTVSIDKSIWESGDEEAINKALEEAVKS